MMLTRSNALFLAALMGLCCTVMLGTYVLHVVFDAPPKKLVTITINPDTSVCYYYPALDESGWSRIPETQRGAYAARVGEGKGSMVEAQTLDCVDYSSCDGKGAECKLTRFRLSEQWYKKTSKKSRRTP